MQRSVSTSVMPSFLQRKRRHPLMSLLGKQRPQKTKEQLIEDILLGTQSLSIVKQRRTNNISSNNDDDVELSSKAKSNQFEDSSRSTRSMISVTENASKSSARQNHSRVSQTTTSTTMSSSVNRKLNSEERAEQAIATIQDENPRSFRSTRSIRRLPKRSSDSSQSNSVAGVPSSPPRDSDELHLVSARTSLRGKNLTSSSGKGPRSYSRRCRRHLNVSAASDGSRPTNSKYQPQEKPNSYRSVSTKDTDSSSEETVENSHRPKSVPNLTTVRKRQAKARTSEPSSRGTRRQSRISNERKKLRSLRMDSLRNISRKIQAESPPSPSGKNAGYIMAFLGPPGSSPSKGEE